MIGRGLATVFRFRSSVRFDSLVPRRLASQTFVEGTFPATTQVSPLLAEAWTSLVRDDALRLPLDHPGRLLSEYFRQRRRSSLGDSVTLANALGERRDTVFLVAGRAEIVSCEAIVAAAAHPWHNLLRGNQRGGRPRVIFLEPTLDTDLLQGAIDLVRRVGEGTEVHDRWAVILIAPADSGDGPQAVELRRDLRDAAAPLVEQLRETAGGDDELRARLIVLDETAEGAAKLVASGTPFHPLLLPRRASLLDGPAMFVSALVGADSISQLKGAVWFWEKEKVKLAHESRVTALAEFLSRTGCRIAVWHHALEPLGRRLAKIGSVPVQAAYSHAGRRELGADGDRPTLHLWSDAVRRDPLNAASLDEAEPRLVVDELRSRYAAMLAEPTATNAEIRVRRLNDIAVGELCQWFTAAKLLMRYVGMPTTSEASGGRKSPGIFEAHER
jgi:hypothetical protein